MTLPPTSRTGLCPVHLGGAPTGLECTRPDGHRDGHTYASTSGVAHTPKEGV